jgi:hypothetical protein
MKRCCLLIAFAALFLSTSWTLATADPDSHPRLFFSASDIARLRQQAQSTHSDIWLPVKQYVDSQLGTSPPQYTPADDTEEQFRDYGNQLIPMSFACIIADTPDYCDLAKTYLLTYSSWTQWDARNRRDLGLAHMLMGNAIAYDWLYSYLTPEERRLVRDSIGRWAQRLYEASAQSYNDAWTNWWAMSYFQNHHWTNNSALGMAGLVLLADQSDALPPAPLNCVVSASNDVNLRAGAGTDFAVVGTLPAGEARNVDSQATGTDGLAWWHTTNDTWVRADVVLASNDCALIMSPESLDPQRWVDQAASQMTIVRDILNHIGDGSWHEGIDYQSYGLTMMLPFLDNLRRLEGIDLLPDDYLRNYPAWRIYNQLPGTSDAILSYGNFETWWGNSYDAQNILRFIAHQYQDPYAEWSAQQVVNADGRKVGLWTAPWMVFEFLYYDPSIAPQPPADWSLSRVFPDLQGVIWRTGWGTDDLVFGLKASAYGGRYAYDTFTQGLYPWQAPCDDSGCTLNTGHDHADASTFYLYGGGQWLAPEREGFRLPDTSYHNAVLIDGQGQYRPTVDYYQQPDVFAGTDTFLTATASTPHFDYVAADATNPYRHNIAGIQDVTRAVVFVRPHYFVMLDHLAAETPHQYEWVSHFGAAPSVDGNWIRGGTDSDQVLGVGIASPQSFQVVTGDDGRPYAHIRTASANAVTNFVNVLYPTTSDGWETKPDFSLTADTGQAVALSVTANDGSADQDDILLSYASPAAPVTLGAYTFDGQVAVIRRQANGDLRALFSFGGTALSDAMGVLVSNLDPASPFEALYDGESVAVSGSITGEIRLYAPDIIRLTVNGADTPFTREGDSIRFISP